MKLTERFSKSERSRTFSELTRLGAWGAFWSAGYGLSVGIFGHAVALTTIFFLTVLTAGVWYVTDRRDRREYAREREE